MTRDELLDIDGRLVAASAAAEPGAAFYALARELVASGVTQPDLYAAFTAHIDRVDDAIFDALADTLDCIHGGGWGGAAAFFDDSPSSEEIEDARERHARLRALP